MATVDRSEYGSTALRQFSGYVKEEWLSDLAGPRGMRMYREMADNDPVIGAVLFAMEMLLRSVPFKIEPETADSADDIEAAAFCNECMSDMEQTWPQMIASILTFIRYGYHVREIVYKMRMGDNKNPSLDSRFNDGRVGWRKMAQRPCESVLRWTFNSVGDAVAFVQLLPTGGPLLTVPLAKCLHFTTSIDKGNPEGRSALRNAYTSYFYRKRIQEIEAIGIERDLCGVPVAWVPAALLSPTASPAEKQQLADWKAAVRDVSRNAQEGFVLPLIYQKGENGTPTSNKLYDLTLMKSGGTRQFDTTKIIDRYDMRIAMTFLADWLTLGQGSTGQRASTAQSKNKTDMFSKAIGGYLDMITAEFNRKAIPDVLALNAMPGRCLMTHGEVARADIADLANAVMQMVQSAIITPDTDLEAHMRAELGLPQSHGEASDELSEGGVADENADTEPGDNVDAGSKE